MTSGLYDYTRDAAFGEALQADLTCSWTSDELLAFAFNDKSHSPTNFEPGTQYQYSNTKRQRVQSRAGGQILAPLELNSTVYLRGTSCRRLPSAAAKPILIDLVTLRMAKRSRRITGVADATSASSTVLTNGRLVSKSRLPRQAPRTLALPRL
jgi:hypothetical protein